MRTVVSMLLMAVVVGCASGPATAGGVAELRLDAGAVASLLGAALPEPVELDLPGVGRVSARLGPVRRVEFTDGGVEAEVVLSIEPAVLGSNVRLRFVPQVERRSGTARLVPDAARLPVLPVDVELAHWIRPAELPRSVRWELEMPGAEPLEVLCFVQGLEVEDERLRIDLALVGGGGRPASSLLFEERLRVEAAMRPASPVETGSRGLPTGGPTR
jgi:hypothetical protein